MPTMLNLGVYSVPDAVRLTGVSPSRIRRWLRGYKFAVKAGRRHSPALWRGQLEPIDGRIALGFMDLLETRCVGALISAGVSWSCLRDAHARAQHWLGHDHPFCCSRFGTDGRTIFLELREDDRHESHLWDIATLQGVFDAVIEPFLGDIEYGAGRNPVRWWPRGPQLGVAVDPRRNFGQPTVLAVGIPTRVLADSANAHGSPDEAARRFEVPVEAILAAIEFERSLSA